MVTSMMPSLGVTFAIFSCYFVHKNLKLAAQNYIEAASVKNILFEEGECHESHYPGYAYGMCQFNRLYFFTRFLRKNK
ncbi:hypothetical protein FACS189473_1890 [Spirochaetia bacterium]|nr:hypothetical protein FACS189473_1890 [Spirochaetia bacterium]